MMHDEHSVYFVNTTELNTHAFNDLAIHIAAEVLNAVKDSITSANRKYHYSTAPTASVNESRRASSARGYLREAYF